MPQSSALPVSLREGLALWQLAWAAETLGMLATSPSEMHRIWTDLEISQIPVWD